MKDQLESLLERMHSLEKEVLRELQKKEQEFFYEVRLGKVRFTEEARAKHQQLVMRFAAYIRGSRFWTVATTPVIWSCLVPIAFVDLAMSVYQMLCFPIDGIPMVRCRDPNSSSSNQKSKINNPQSTINPTSSPLVYSIKSPSSASSSPPVTGVSPRLPNCRDRDWCLCKFFVTRIIFIPV